MNEMKIYISAPSPSLPQGSIRGCSVAHLDYSVGPGGRLLRLNRATAYKGGLLVIKGSDLPPGGNGLLASEIANECRNRGYKGVVADLGPGCDLSFLPGLMNKLSGLGLRLFVPEGIAAGLDGAMVVCTTAISGGSLSQRLDELCAKYGPERIALDVERLAIDFLLPSPDGSGTALSRRELSNLLSSRNAQTFFSGDLCAHYFTYSQSGAHHFVLYDTAASIKKKLTIAASKGIGQAFLLYSEVEDILPSIVGRA